ncbi:hypothetical protein KIPB_000997 [Kipferlia bialata]|uniref:Uncharacterized protein n=1 Tax=Kipferlia bialata TaxID=797122 RepID=A0A9K3GDW5_9EUKA|nr:hypothetical protein KIPB_000997 [Kipferlia bialata]|eukprot:g997.t1
MSSRQGVTLSSTPSSHARKNVSRVQLVSSRNRQDGPRIISSTPAPPGTSRMRPIDSVSASPPRVVAASHSNPHALPAMNPIKDVPSDRGMGMTRGRSMVPQTSSNTRPDKPKGKADRKKDSHPRSPGGDRSPQAGQASEGGKGLLKPLWYKEMPFWRQYRWLTLWGWLALVTILLGVCCVYLLRFVSSGSVSTGQDTLVYGSVSADREGALTVDRASGTDPLLSLSAVNTDTSGDTSGLSPLVDMTWDTGAGTAGAAYPVLSVATSDGAAPAVLSISSGTETSSSQEAKAEGRSHSGVVGAPSAHEGRGKDMSGAGVTKSTSTPSLSLSGADLSVPDNAISAQTIDVDGTGHLSASDDTFIIGSDGSAVVGAEGGVALNASPTSLPSTSIPASGSVHLVHRSTRDDSAGYSEANPAVTVYGTGDATTSDTDTESRLHIECSDTAMSAVLSLGDERVAAEAGEILLNGLYEIGYSRHSDSLSLSHTAKGYPDVSTPILGVAVDREVSDMGATLTVAGGVSSVFEADVTVGQVQIAESTISAADSATLTLAPSDNNSISLSDADVSSVGSLCTSGLCISGNEISTDGDLRLSAPDGNIVLNQQSMTIETDYFTVASLVFAGSAITTLSGDLSLQSASGTVAMAGQTLSLDGMDLAAGGITGTDDLVLASEDGSVSVDGDLEIVGGVVLTGSSYESRVTARGGTVYVGTQGTDDVTLRVGALELTDCSISTANSITDEGNLTLNAYSRVISFAGNDLDGGILGTVTASSLSTTDDGMVLSGSTITTPGDMVISPGGDIDIGPSTIVGSSTAGVELGGMVSLDSLGLHALLSDLTLEASSGRTVLTHASADTGGTPSLVIGDATLDSDSLQNTSDTLSIVGAPLKLSSQSLAVSVTSDMTVGSVYTFKAGDLDITSNTLSSGSGQDLRLVADSEVLRLPEGHTLFVGTLGVESTTSTITAEDTLTFGGGGSDPRVTVESGSTFEAGTMEMYDSHITSSAGGLFIDDLYINGNSVSLTSDEDLYLSPVDGYSLILDADFVSSPVGAISALSMSATTVTAGTNLKLSSSSVEATSVASALKLVSASGEVTVSTASGSSVSPKISVGEISLNSDGLVSSSPVSIQSVEIDSTSIGTVDDDTLHMVTSTRLGTVEIGTNDLESSERYTIRTVSNDNLVLSPASDVMILDGQGEFQAHRASLHRVYLSADDDDDYSSAVVTLTEDGIDSTRSFTTTVTSTHATTANLISLTAAASIELSGDVNLAESNAFTVGNLSLSSDTISNASVTDDLTISSGTDTVALPTSHSLTIGNIEIDSPNRSISSTGSLDISCGGALPSLIVDSGTTLFAAAVQADTIVSGGSAADGNLSIDAVATLSLGTSTAVNTVIGSTDNAVELKGTLDLGSDGLGVSIGASGFPTVLHGTDISIGTSDTDGAVAIGRAAADSVITFAGSVNLGTADGATINAGSGTSSVNLNGNVTIGGSVAGTGSAVRIGDTAGTTDIGGVTLNVAPASSTTTALTMGHEGSTVQMHGSAVGIGTATTDGAVTIGREGETVVILGALELPPTAVSTIEIASNLVVNNMNANTDETDTLGVGTATPLIEIGHSACAVSITGASDIVAASGADVAIGADADNTVSVSATTGHVVLGNTQGTVEVYANDVQIGTDSSASGSSVSIGHSDGSVVLAGGSLSINDVSITTNTNTGVSTIATGSSSLKLFSSAGAISFGSNTLSGTAVDITSLDVDTVDAATSVLTPLVSTGSGDLSLASASGTISMGAHALTATTTGSVTVGDCSLTTEGLEHVQELALVHHSLSSVNILTPSSTAGLYNAGTLTVGDLTVTDSQIATAGVLTVNAATGMTVESDMTVEGAALITDVTIDTSSVTASGGTLTLSPTVVMGSLEIDGSAAVPTLSASSGIRLIPGSSQVVTVDETLTVGDISLSSNVLSYTSASLLIQADTGNSLKLSDYSIGQPGGATMEFGLSSISLTTTTQLLASGTTATYAGLVASTLAPPEGGDLTLGRVGQRTTFLGAVELDNIASDILTADTKVVTPAVSADADLTIDPGSETDPVNTLSLCSVNGNLVMGRSGADVTLHATTLLLNPSSGETILGNLVDTTSIVGEFEVQSEVSSSTGYDLVLSGASGMDVVLTAGDADASGRVLLGQGLYVSDVLIQAPTDVSADFTVGSGSTVLGVDIGSSKVTVDDTLVVTDTLAFTATEDHSISATATSLDINVSGVTSVLTLTSAGGIVVDSEDITVGTDSASTSVEVKGTLTATLQTPPGTADAAVTTNVVSAHTGNGLSLEASGATVTVGGTGTSGVTLGHATSVVQVDAGTFTLTAGTSVTVGPGVLTGNTVGQTAVLGSAGYAVTVLGDSFSAPSAVIADAVVTGALTSLSLSGAASADYAIDAAAGKGLLLGGGTATVSIGDNTNAVSTVNVEGAKIHIGSTSAVLSELLIGTAAVETEVLGDLVVDGTLSGASSLVIGTPVTTSDGVTLTLSPAAEADVVIDGGAMDTVADGSVLIGTHHTDHVTVGAPLYVSTVSSLDSQSLSLSASSGQTIELASDAGVYIADSVGSGSPLVQVIPGTTFPVLAVDTQVTGRVKVVTSGTTVLDTEGALGVVLNAASDQALLIGPGAESVVIGDTTLGSAYVTVDTTATTVAIDGVAGVSIGGTHLTGYVDIGSDTPSAGVRLFGDVSLSDSDTLSLSVQRPASFTKTVTVVDITGDTVALDGSTAVTVGTTSGDVEIGHTVNVGTLGTTAVSIQGTSVDIAGDGGSLSLASAGVTTQVQGDLEVKSKLSVPVGNTLALESGTGNSIVLNSSLSAASGTVDMQCNMSVTGEASVAGDVEFGTASNYISLDTSVAETLDITTVAGVDITSDIISISATTTSVSGTLDMTLAQPTMTDLSLVGTLTVPVVDAAASMTIDAGGVSESVSIGSLEGNVALGRDDAGDVSITGATVNILTTGVGAVTVGSTGVDVNLNGSLLLASALGSATGTDLTLTAATGQSVVLTSHLKSDGTEIAVDSDILLDGALTYADSASMVTKAGGGTHEFLSASDSVLVLSGPASGTASLSCTAGVVSVGTSALSVSIGDTGVTTTVLGELSLETVTGTGDVDIDAGAASTLTLGGATDTIQVGQAAVSAVSIVGASVDIGTTGGSGAVTLGSADASVTIGGSLLVGTVTSEPGADITIGPDGEADVTINAGQTSTNMGTIYIGKDYTEQVEIQSDLKITASVVSEGDDILFVPDTTKSVKVSALSGGGLIVSNSSTGTAVFSALTDGVTCTDSLTAGSLVTGEINPDGDLQVTMASNQDVGIELRDVASFEITKNGEASPYLSVSTANSGLVSSSVPVEFTDTFTLGVPDTSYGLDGSINDVTLTSANSKVLYLLAPDGTVNLGTTSDSLYLGKATSLTTVQGDLEVSGSLSAVGSELEIDSILVAGSSGVLQVASGISSKSGVDLDLASADGDLSLSVTTSQKIYVNCGTTIAEFDGSSGGTPLTVTGETKIQGDLVVRDSFSADTAVIGVVETNENKLTNSSDSAAGIVIQNVKVTPNSITTTDTGLSITSQSGTVSVAQVAMNGGVATLNTLEAGTVTLDDTSLRDTDMAFQVEAAEYVLYTSDSMAYSLAKSYAANTATIGQDFSTLNLIDSNVQINKSTTSATLYKVKFSGDGHLESSSGGYLNFDSPIVCDTLSLGKVTNTISSTANLILKSDNNSGEVTVPSLLRASHSSGLVVGADGSDTLTLKAQSIASTGVLAVEAATYELQSSAYAGTHVALEWNDADGQYLLGDPENSGSVLVDTLTVSASLTVDSIDGVGSGIDLEDLTIFGTDISSGGAMSLTAPSGLTLSTSTVTASTADVSVKTLSATTSATVSDITLSSGTISTGASLLRINSLGITGDVVTSPVTNTLTIDVDTVTVPDLTVSATLTVPEAEVSTTLTVGSEDNATHIVMTDNSITSPDLTLSATVLDINGVGITTGSAVSATSLDATSVTLSGSLAISSTLTIDGSSVNLSAGGSVVSPTYSVLSADTTTYPVITHTAGTGVQVGHASQDLVLVGTSVSAGNLVLSNNSISASASGLSLDLEASAGVNVVGTLSVSSGTVSIGSGSLNLSAAASVLTLSAGGTFSADTATIGSVTITGSSVKHSSGVSTALTLQGLTVTDASLSSVSGTDPVSVTAPSFTVGGVTLTKSTSAVDAALVSASTSVSVGTSTLTQSALSVVGDFALTAGGATGITLGSDVTNTGYSITSTTFVSGTTSLSATDLVGTSAFSVTGGQFLVTDDVDTVVGLSYSTGVVVGDASKTLDLAGTDVTVGSLSLQSGSLSMDGATLSLSANTAVVITDPKVNVLSFTTGVVTLSASASDTLSLDNAANFDVGSSDIYNANLLISGNSLTGQGSSTSVLIHDVEITGNEVSSSDNTLNLKGTDIYLNDAHISGTGSTTMALSTVQAADTVSVGGVVSVTSAGVSSTSALSISSTGDVSVNGSAFAAAGSLTLTSLTVTDALTVSTDAVKTADSSVPIQAGSFTLWDGVETTPLSLASVSGGDITIGDSGSALAFEASALSIGTISFSGSTATSTAGELQLNGVGGVISVGQLYTPAGIDVNGATISSDGDDLALGHSGGLKTISLTASTVSVNNLSIAGSTITDSGSSGVTVEGLTFDGSEVSGAGIDFKSSAEFSSGLTIGAASFATDGLKSDTYTIGVAEVGVYGGATGVYPTALSLSGSDLEVGEGWGSVVIGDLTITGNVVGCASLSFTGDVSFGAAVTFTTSPIFPATVSLTTLEVTTLKTDTLQSSLGTAVLSYTSSKVSLTSANTLELSATNAITLTQGTSVTGSLSVSSDIKLGSSKLIAFSDASSTLEIGSGFDTISALKPLDVTSLTLGGYEALSTPSTSTLYIGSADFTDIEVAATSIALDGDANVTGALSVGGSAALSLSSTTLVVGKDDGTGDVIVKDRLEMAKGLVSSSDTSIAMLGEVGSSSVTISAAVGSPTVISTQKAGGYKVYFVLSSPDTAFLDVFVDTGSTSAWIEHSIPGSTVTLKIKTQSSDNSVQVYSDTSGVSVAYTYVRVYESV